MQLSLLLAALPAVCFAAKLTVEIPPSTALPVPATLPASSHAILVGPSGVRIDAPIRRDSSFVFDALSPASYLLTVHAHDYYFPPLRVDVETSEAEEVVTAWQTFRGNEWSNKGPQYGSAKSELSIHVRPLGAKDFYQPRGGFSILNFLKSPMILMALFSVAMIFGMPLLMDNLDPEMKAELEEAQKQSPFSGSAGAASSLQNFDLAGFLSGKSSNAEPVPAAASPKRK